MTSPDPQPPTTYTGYRAPEEVPHYNTGSIEVIDALEDWGLIEDAYLFNVVKYVARHGKKSTGPESDADLVKAYRYLHRRITGEWPTEDPSKRTEPSAQKTGYRPRGLELCPEGAVGCRPAVTKEDLGKAWDLGWETASRMYWGGKPRNPFTGDLNDADPDDYCPSHGGSGSPEDCGMNPLPSGEPCPGASDLDMEDLP